MNANEAAGFAQMDADYYRQLALSRTEQLAEARAEVAALKDAIRDAPHAEDCHATCTTYNCFTCNGEPVCDCWKRVLGDAPSPRQEQCTYKTPCPGGRCAIEDHWPAVARRAPSPGQPG